MTGQDSRFDV